MLDNENEVFENEGMDETSEEVTAEATSAEATPEAETTPEEVQDFEPEAETAEALDETSVEEPVEEVVPEDITPEASEAPQQETPVDGTYHFSYRKQAAPGGAYSSDGQTGYSSQAGFTSAYSNVGGEGVNGNSSASYDKDREAEEKLIAQARRKAEKKAAKRAKKANKKTAKKTGKSKGKGFAKLVAAAVVFGLVAGTVFQGVRYGSDALLGKNDETATVSTDITSDTTTEVATTESSTQTVSTTTVSTVYDVATVAQEVLPSIVSITGIYVTTTEFFFNTYEQESEGCGSGIIISIDEDYIYILTNYHVVEDSKSLAVGFVDEASVEATIKSYDASNDVAVVTVDITQVEDSTLAEIKEIAIGSSDDINVGDPCVAIGNALGYGQSVTVGYVSALNREIDTDEGTTITVLQTDAAINPGNSGGALVNMNGELIGINTAKYVDSTVEGMGYAIPISNISDLVDDLLTTDQTSITSGSGNGYLGVSVTDITQEYSVGLGMPEGVYIYSVSDNSPAEKCGLQAGDIIVAVDNTEISDTTSLQAAISSHNAGETVTITYYRNQNGQYVKSTVTATLEAKTS